MTEAIHAETAKAVETKGLPQSAALLAYAGALPLLIAGIFTWTGPAGLGAVALNFILAYATTLLAFFGGVRWGVAVMRRDGPDFTHLIGAVLPVFMAVALMFIDQTLIKLALLAVIFPALLFDDLRTTRKGTGAPGWYLGVRAPLTALMEISLLLALAKVVLG